MYWLQRFASAVLALATLPVAAADFPLPPPGVDVIGRVTRVAVAPGETLLDIGRRHGIGYQEMRLANPETDVWMPPPGSEVRVPNRFVLPHGPRQGLVLNVAEMRLYYFPKRRTGAGRRVETFAVAIGRMDWRTPLGETRITAKTRDPSWYPPESIRAEAAADGEPLPEVVPPGPNNPLGRFKMRLGIPGYLIHGTNRPWGVGMRVTHGCVRMFPEDIARLFPRVAVETPVRIVDQPVKAGWVADTLFVEIHPEFRDGPTSNRPRPPTLTTALEAVAEVVGRGPARVDYERLRRAVSDAQGIPVVISRRPFH